jgi:hypothetical protein
MKISTPEQPDGEQKQQDTRACEVLPRALHDEDWGSLPIERSLPPTLPCTASGRESFKRDGMGSSATPKSINSRGGFIIPYNFIPPCCQARLAARHRRFPRSRHPRLRHPG